MIDNKTGEDHRYCISVFTAIRSSRYVTSTPYFKLDGKLASTGERILCDGKRIVRSINFIFGFLEIKLFCLKIYTRFKRLITIVSNAILNNFTLIHLNIYLFLRILEVAHAAIL